MCKEDEESIDHLLLHFSLAKEVWDTSFSLFPYLGSIGWCLEGSLIYSLVGKEDLGGIGMVWFGEPNLTTWWGVCVGREMLELLGVVYKLFHVVESSDRVGADVNNEVSYGCWRQHTLVIWWRSLEYCKSVLTNLSCEIWDIRVTRERKKRKGLWEIYLRKGLGYCN